MSDYNDAFESSSTGRDKPDTPAPRDWRLLRREDGNKNGGHIEGVDGPVTCVYPAVVWVHVIEHSAYTTLEQKCARLEGELAKERDAVHEENIKLKFKNEAFEARVRELEAERDALKIWRTDWFTQRDECKEFWLRAKNAEAERDALKAKLAECEGKRDKFAMTILELEKKLAAAEAERDELVTTLLIERQEHGCQTGDCPHTLHSDCEKTIAADRQNPLDRLEKQNAELLRSRDEALEWASKLADFVSSAQCDCSVAERDSGHLIGCWRPDLDSMLEAYQAWSNGREGKA